MIKCWTFSVCYHIFLSLNLFVHFTADMIFTNQWFVLIVQFVQICISFLSLSVLKMLAHWGSAVNSFIQLNQNIRPKTIMELFGNKINFLKISFKKQQN